MGCSLCGYQSHTLLLETRLVFTHRGTWWFLQIIVITDLLEIVYVDLLEF